MLSIASKIRQLTTGGIYVVPTEYMTLYQRLCRTVFPRALLGPEPAHSASPLRADRLSRTPLLFETLEPRVLLSGDPITAAAQTAILSGLQSFQTWTANSLNQAAQLAQQLPVVSTSLGDLVNVPGQVQTLLVQPAKAYFAATTTPTIEALGAALQADVGAAGSVVGQFAHGEFLITLGAFEISTSISAALNLTEDTAGISLQIGPPPTLSGQATVSLSLTLGFDPGTENTPNTAPTFFIDSGSITAGVTLAASGFAAAVTLGVANATVSGGSAGLSATATVTLKDPVVGDPTNDITQAELTTQPVTALTATSLSGSASLTLPLTSSLVSAAQTLKLNWTGDLTGVGSNNLASLGSWAQLDTIAPSLLRQAVTALPGLIQSAVGSAGFGGSVPVLGSGLGSLLSFGSTFANAAAAVANATSLNQVQTAPQALPGVTVSFTVNTAGNELDMLVTASNSFATTLPFAIDTPLVGSDALSLSGSLTATGTAKATLQLALSFDTTVSDTDRIAIVANGSALSLSFDAVTGTPITATAALGLLRLQVNAGTIAVGAATSNGADPTHPATVTIGFKADRQRQSHDHRRRAGRLTRHLAQFAAVV